MLFFFFFIFISTIEITSGYNLLQYFINYNKRQRKKLKHRYSNNYNNIIKVHLRNQKEVSKERNKITKLIRGGTLSWVVGKIKTITQLIKGKEGVLIF